MLLDYGEWAESLSGRAALRYGSPAYSYSALAQDPLQACVTETHAEGLKIGWLHAEEQGFWLNPLREFLGGKDSTGDPVFLKGLWRNTEQVLVSGNQKIRVHFFTKGKIMVIHDIS